MPLVIKENSHRLAFAGLFRTPSRAIDLRNKRSIHSPYERLAEKIIQVYLYQTKEPKATPSQCATQKTYSIPSADIGDPHGSTTSAPTQPGSAGSVVAGIPNRQDRPASSPHASDVNITQNQSQPEVRISLFPEAEVERHM